MTDRASVVLDVSIEHAGQTYTASYFVEHNVVHVRIGDRMLVVPLMNQDTVELVKSHLREHALSRARPVAPAPQIWQSGRTEA